MSPWVHRIMGAIVLVAMAALAVTALPHFHFSEVVPILTAALILFVAKYLSLFVHELGHVLAGWMVGMRFEHMEFGAFGLRRNGGRVIAYRTPRGELSGEAAMRSRSLDALRTRLMVLYVGGMVANLVSASIAAVMFVAALVQDAGWPVKLFWLSFGIASIIDISVSADSRPQKHRTDGQMMRELRTKDERGETNVFKHALEVVKSSNGGPELLLQVVRDFGGGASAWSLIGAFDMALEMNSGVAGEILGLALAKDASVRLRSRAAFLAALRGRNLPLATATLPAEGEGVGEDVVPHLMAATMVALASQRFGEAVALAERALAEDGCDEESRKWFELAIKSARSKIPGAG